MKRLALLVFVAFTITLNMTAQERHERRHGAAHAQQGQHFSPEEFRQKLESYVRANTNLSDDEAAAYFPLQHEMYEELRKINDSMRNVKKSVNEQTTEEDAAQAVTQLLALQQKESQIRAEYYKKISAKIGSLKLMQAIKAEDRFHREMLRPKRRN